MAELRTQCWVCSAELGCLMPASCDLPQQCLATALKDMQASQDQEQEAAGLLQELLESQKQRAKPVTEPDFRYAGTALLSQATACSVCSLIELN